MKNSASLTTAYSSCQISRDRAIAALPRGNGMFRLHRRYASVLLSLLMVVPTCALAQASSGNAAGQAAAAAHAALTAGTTSAPSGTVHYYYTDPQGTPLMEADASGNITATFDYAPYGAQAMGTAANGPGYTGHVNDPDTGLVYMQARYYDPTTGQFLSADPVPPATGNLFNFNRYAYANNNPVLNIDPDGRDPMNLYTDPKYAQQLFGHLSPNESRMVLGGSGVIFGSAILLAVTPEAAMTAIAAKATLAGKQIAQTAEKLTLNEGKKILTAQENRSIRSLEKQIAKHEAKISEFKANPTVRPGMENMSKEQISAQQTKRIEHLEKEIKTFKENISKIKDEK